MVLAGTRRPAFGARARRAGPPGTVLLNMRQGNRLIMMSDSVTDQAAPLGNDILPVYGPAMSDGQSEVASALQLCAVPHLERSLPDRASTKMRERGGKEGQRTHSQGRRWMARLAMERTKAGAHLGIPSCSLLSCLFCGL